MKLIKDTLDNILLLNGTNTVRKWADIPTQLILNFDAVIIQQAGFEDYAMYAADIDSYQVLPAVTIAFSGSASELLDVLKNNFFLSSSVVVGIQDVNIVSPIPLDVNVVNPTSVTFSNDLFDAFYRLRTSMPQTIFDSKQLADKGELFFDDQQTSGSGTTSTHSPNRASTTIGVANLTAGVRVRQTFRRFNYQPGKSQLVITTFVAGASVAGITRRVGLFDASNGIFFQQTGAGAAVVIRSFVTGAAVDNVFLQADWNIDKMNGSGASGIDLDFTKSQIFFFDFEWLGVGRVRCGWFINGVPYYCHAFNHSNILGAVYMSTPNLPIRYEIQNSGAGPAATFEHICSTVSSEGGQQAAGLGLGISRGVTAMTTLNDTDIYPVLTMRLRSTYRTSSVKPTDFNILCTSTAAYNWYLLLNPTTTGTALVYTAVTNSSIEANTTSTNATKVTAGTGTILKTGVGSQSNASDIGGTIDAINDFFLGSNIGGTADVLMLAVQRISGTTETFYGSLNFLDQK
jgi:hypothetical protein